MNRGLKFDILLALTLAYIYLLSYWIWGAVPQIFSSTFSGYVLFLRILLLTLLLVAPAFVLYLCRPKDRKALRFFFFWLLALGFFFVLGGLLPDPFMTVIIVPEALILFWIVSYRPDFFLR
jgi:hypothetical protein